jgi:hypothetical protein
MSDDRVRHGDTGAVMSVTLLPGGKVSALPRELRLCAAAAPLVEIVLPADAARELAGIIAAQDDVREIMEKHHAACAGMKVSAEGLYALAQADLQHSARLLWMCGVFWVVGVAALALSIWGPV